MLLAESTGSSGICRHAGSSQKDGRCFVDEVSIVRATRASAETEAMAGVLIGKTVRVCSLHQGWQGVAADHFSGVWRARTARRFPLVVDGAAPQARRSFAPWQAMAPAGVNPCNSMNV